MRVESFADAVVSEAIGGHQLFGEEVTAIEDVGRLLHYLVELLIVVAFESIPFRQDEDGVRILHCFLCCIKLAHSSSISFLPQFVELNFVDKLNKNSSTCYKDVCGSKICK
jgi:hypothetical protein